ncbi:hypothetical protein [Paractinoplanes durhamensis]|uniref:Uncharacterized protein n=1 Tax=Paractinoplanes durhamensis TaxID=113563 RepID=A0ABQ3YZV4_9ACTN|nr:hypothetical protein [Actinoplanes durhamensis]GIE03092.1 hypothetical protein Adu01nite_44420 [Actinoplanes durhamensis]
MKPRTSGALRRVLAALEHIVQRGTLKLGASPLDALCRAHPDFHAAFVHLDLRLRIARTLPGADPGQAAVKAARRDLDAILGQLTDEQSEAARAWLRQTVGRTPAAKDTDGLLKAVRRRLDVEYALKDAPATPFPAAVARLAAALPKTAFDKLYQVAARDGLVARALQAFERSCLLDTPEQIAAAGRNLQNAVLAAGLPAKQRNRITQAVETVVLGFGRTQTSADGLAVVESFFRRFNRLHPTDPIVDVYARLQSWLTTDDLEILGTALSRCTPVPKVATTAEKLADQIGGRVSVYVGLLGQLIGQKGPYRRLFETELRRAAAFAESKAGAGYAVRIGRTPVRALNKNAKSFAQFFDDTILLVDKANKKVAIAFRGQFKAGDAASREVLAQLDSDDARKALGKLLLDGEQYEIVDGLLPERSAIVTTTLGVTQEETWKNGKKVVTRTSTDPAAVADALGDREVTFLPMPVLPDDLRAFVKFLLEAAEKVPRS